MEQSVHVHAGWCGRGDRGAETGVRRPGCGAGRHQLLLDLLLLTQADLLQLVLVHALPAIGGHAVGPEGAGRLLRVLGEQAPAQQVGDLGQVVLLFLFFL